MIPESFLKGVGIQNLIKHNSIPDQKKRLLARKKRKKKK